MNPTNAKILLLDLVFDPAQIAYLKEVSLNFGADISFLSYDCNPLIAPQYWPIQVSEGFINYISLVSYSKRVWSISRTAQDDIKKFSNADLDKISFDFKWLPPFDFPACAHDNPLVRGLEEEEFILMVASFVPSKNHLGFLQALQLLQARGLTIPKVYFVGGGSWIAPKIDSKILELSNLGIQVARYEGIENCCLARFYENCTFSILPSFIEGFGLPIVESLSFGKPVVTSDSTSMGELLVLPGTIGFSHEHSPNLEEILEQLISKRELLGTLTAEALEVRSTLGTWEEYAAELYEFVMGKKQ
jgi:glycosyltransferase involved in cell wall biosynthesis